MSPHLKKILNALEKTKSIPAKEKASLRKELEKEVNTIEQNQAILSKLKRELKIEASLEVIRARTMAMQSTDELTAVLSLLFEQFDVLGIHPSFAHLTLFNEANDTFSIRITGTSGQRVIAEHVIDMDSYPAWHESYEKWKKGPPGIVDCIDYPPEVVPAVFEIMAPIFDKLPSGSEIKAEDFSEGVYTTQGHCQYGYIGFNHSRRATEEEKEIVQKFAKEFGRLYQRFLDIQKAEAQAREAQIETALEKVRSRTMAMHKSEELAETALVLYEQFAQLGNIPDRMSIGVFTEETREVTLWGTDQSGSQINQKFTGSWKRSAVMTNFYKNWKAGGDSLVADLSGQKLKVWLKFIREEMKLFVDDTNIKGRRVQQAAFYSHGFLLLTTNDPVANEIMQLLVRFAKVFSQTYTRFLDLQKAEAQAREAHIEVSLERIRARSMAMHSSEELNEVLRVMFQQVEALGIDAKCAHLTLMDLENNSFSFRITGKNGAANMGEQIIDLNAMPIWKETVAKWKKAKPHSHQCLVYPPEILPDLWKLIDTSLKSLPYKERIKISDFPNGLFDCEGHNKFGYIGFNNSRPPTDEEIRIVIRFAREFERVYQRFLDIQKAESQAREAQIEAALERVRSKTMAMHNSQDLEDIVISLFDEVMNLGLDKSLRCGIGILEGHEGMETRSVNANPDGTLELRVGMLNMAIHPMLVGLKKAWKKGSKEYSYEYTAKDVRKYYEALNNDPGYPFNADLEKLPERQFHKSFFYSSGILFAFSENPISEESSAILARFAAVFGQTYRRFLDLQKAEAQAREAQIEAALERVRARTMAMHNTDDIGITVTTFFKELLGLHSDSSIRCGVGILSQSEHMELWTASIREASQTVLDSGTLDMSLHPLLKGVKKTWRTKAKAFSYTLKGKDVMKYFRILNEAPDYPAHFDLKAIPKTVYHNSFVFSDGVLFAFTEAPLQEDIRKVLERFTSVFGQTYTRFLDLQKAEAQAREAQIEAALERVRSRSMGMQKSSEMQQVADEIHNQLASIGIKFDAFGMSGVIEGESDYEVWVGGQHLEEPLRIPYNEATQVQREYNKVLSERPEIYMQSFSGKEMQEYFDYMLTRVEFSQNLIDLMQSCHSFTTSITTCKNSSTQLVRYNDEIFTEEENEVLKRFGKVFEQAYIRFLDLQKAEAQVREAQIEAALERVRARAMAMHNTGELSEVLSVLFDQFDILGVNPTWAHLSLISLEDNTFTYRMTGPKGRRHMAEQIVALDARPEWQDAIEAFKKADPNTVNMLHFPKEVLPQVWDLFSETLNSFPEGEGFKHEDFPDGLYNIQGHCKFGYIGFNHARPPTEEEKDIVARFAKEFGRLYQRFLDIEKAEAQAREAQIQLSLERVRARSMAMHSSDELNDVLSILFQQFDVLGIKPVTAFLSLFDIENNTFTYRSTSKAGNRMQTQQVVNLNSMEIWQEMAEKWKNDKQDSLEVIYYPPDVLPQLFGLFEETFSAMPQEERMTMADYPNGGYSMHGYCKFGYIGYNHTRLPTDEEKEILIKFATEFGRVYQRFLDLQKAEAQANESEIQLALERVRARTMAMHKSAELSEVAEVLFEQISLLTTSPDRFQIGIIPEEARSISLWLTDQNGHRVTQKFEALASKSPVIRKVIRAWKNQDSYVVLKLKGKALENWVRYMGGELGIPFKNKHVGMQRHISGVFFSNGFIGTTTLEALDLATLELIERFSNVFQQTYTRFLDLQKAEERAREAQIEAALERIRAKSMAMHASEELSDVLEVLFEQFVILEINPVFAVLNLYDLENDTFTMRVTGKNGAKVIGTQTVKFSANEIWKDYGEKFRQGNPDMISDQFYPTEILPDVWETLKDLVHAVPEDVRPLPSDFPDGLYNIEGYCKYGTIGCNLNRPPTEEEKNIVIKFATEFGRLYQRFLDIQKAEAQAREAKIEAALEKVRSRSLAMQKPGELQEVVTVVGEKLQELGVILDSGGVVICTYFPDSKDVMHWTASFDTTHPSVPYYLPYFDTPIWKETWASKWETDDDFFEKVFSFEDKNHFFNKAFEISDYKNLPEEYKKELLAVENHALSFAWQTNSALMIASHNGKLLPGEHKTILKRFARVFEQAYIRFMDLQKAEAQARESKIEMALEKVRSRTMAMHKSEELGEVAAVLFEQISSLTYAPERFNIAIGNREEKSFDIWVTDQKGHEVSKRFMFQVEKSPVVSEVFKAWGKKPYIVQELHGKKLQKWVRYMQEEIGIPFDEARLSEHRYINSVFFSHGCIGITTNEPPETETLELIERFSKVFQQTYVRFLDLQKAEVQAKNAIKQASLDRVRGEIASMRSTKDLERITPLVWNELKALEIPFIRCGVFIINEADHTVQAFLSAPDGKSLGVMKIPFNSDKDTDETVAHWKRHEVYRTHWDKKEFLTFMQSMKDLGQVSNEKEYQGSEQPPESLYLHFVPFTQGMMYVGNMESLDQEQIEMVQSLADAFAIAYARYEDFVRLENAKESVEKTLSELKTTQNQLVQSEKMASLGELTAGIAHEIQNPLNFVNNFSEVSKELIEEMLEEMQKGDMEEVKALADDIIQNLEKIHHHGQRADGIVKGMLQHSRSSTGEKEPTDINVLADEYLRLAYHGLRAKDKSFNATLETDFDESIGKVDVLAQDLGRVILNLITNAFYAVKEKSSKALAKEGDKYQPTVTVSTKKTKEGIEISVRDNGNGIPEAIKEKIFQPFFTTKPTGQGTGLGLSMSYDIVTKGHGGKLIVETKEGVGTEFIIVIKES